jgi:hypothetical protein
MEYSSVLGILAIFFGLVGALGFGLKGFSPEPPPKGGVKETAAKMSFAEFHRTRSKALNRDRDTIHAERRSA